MYAKKKSPLTCQHDYDLLFATYNSLPAKFDHERKKKILSITHYFFIEYFHLLDSGYSEEFRDTLIPEYEFNMLYYFTHNTTYEEKCRRESLVWKVDLPTSSNFIFQEGMGDEAALLASDFGMVAQWKIGEYPCCFHKDVLVGKCYCDLHVSSGNIVIKREPKNSPQLSQDMLDLALQKMLEWASAENAVAISEAKLDGISMFMSGSAIICNKGKMWGETLKTPNIRKTMRTAIDNMKEFNYMSVIGSGCLLDIFGRLTDDVVEAFSYIDSHGELRLTPTIKRLLSSMKESDILYVQRETGSVFPCRDLADVVHYDHVRVLAGHSTFLKGGNSLFVESIILDPQYEPEDDDEEDGNPLFSDKLDEIYAVANTYQDKPMCIVDYMSKVVIKFTQLDPQSFIDILHLLMRGKKVKLSQNVVYVGWRLVNIGYAITDDKRYYIPSSMVSKTLRGQLDLSDTMPFPSFINIKRLFDEDLQIVFVVPFLRQNAEHHRYISVDFAQQCVIVATSMSSLPGTKRKVVAFPGCSQTLLVSTDPKWWSTYLLGRIKLYAIAVFSICAARDPKLRNNVTLNNFWTMITSSIVATDTSTTTWYIYPNLSTHSLPTTAQDTNYVVNPIGSFLDSSISVTAMHFKVGGLIHMINTHFAYLSRVGTKMLKDIIFCSGEGKSEYWVWFPGKQKGIYVPGVELDLYDHANDSA